ncbi:acyltransferase family protein [Polaromonas jejuensis]|uniref:Acyltransferase family protein n=1 Tax=Polaromonas jejuensis TaxID=457502 RepID=A0ABW0QC85_9BURK|nr:acyltransferase family protein [Polaromonas jejuensis]
MRSPEQRLRGIDALKGMACALIVWHHLAFYGPMSDVVHAFVPGLTDWLYDYGRMAVQVFLVVGGFLAASSLAPQGQASFRQPGRLLLRRYRRLLQPYLLALAVSVLVAALVRPWFEHPSVPEAPTSQQVLAHVLLLQDVLGLEALSAGVWYVAIDFQLFVISVLILAFARQLQQRWPQLPVRLGMGLLLLLLAMSSLLFFNRRAGLDMTGLYFFGSYALGMMAFWASNTASEVRRGQWLLAIALLGGAALLLDFRGRIALALVLALGLVWLQKSAWPRPWREPRWLVQLGQMSYSVFLIHFPACLLVNAVVSFFWPTQLMANALGMLAAFVLSLLAGALLYRLVESRQLPARGASQASPPLAIIPATAAFVDGS